jgi:DNA-binding CsgD family transcriptional regulator
VPQSLGRVPSQIATPKLVDQWLELARPLGIGFQLSLPLRYSPGEHYAFVLSRPDREFDEEELTLAATLQPILAELFAHQVIPAGVPGHKEGRSQGPQLTPRETTILCLLSRGLTAESVARQLNISSRTVSKHLEHVYRKLGVCDRLMAVQRAAELGLRGTPFH